MPGRISKHAFAVEFGRAKTKHVRRRIGDVLDHDVEVHLLRDGRARPGRRTMARSELERETGGRLVGRDDYEIVAGVGDRMFQECGVEPCEPSRVRTVEDEVVQASAHALNGLIQRPQLPEQHGRVGCWGIQLRDEEDHVNAKSAQPPRVPVAGSAIRTAGRSDKAARPLMLAGRPEAVELRPMSLGRRPGWAVNDCRALGPLPLLTGGERPGVGYHSLTRRGHCWFISFGAERWYVLASRALSGSFHRGKMYRYVRAESDLDRQDWLRTEQNVYLSSGLITPDDLVDGVSRCLRCALPSPACL